MSEAEDKSDLIMNVEWTQTAIDAEYQLIDGRLNTLLVLNGILFGFFGIIVSDMADDDMQAQYVANTIPWVGVISSIVVGLSIFAGIQEINRYKRRRDEIFTRLKEFCDIAPLGAPSNGLPHFFGVLPAAILPVLLLAAWGVSMFVW